MANRQISASQIRPGTTIIVQGTITYARIRSLLGPEDIDKVNDVRRNSRFKLDRNKPITRLALHNAAVVPANPNQMSPEEFFVHERMYESSVHPELGRQWSIDNKSTMLPGLFRLIDGQATQITDDQIPASQNALPTEPARDQQVTVILNVYASNTGNNGVGIAAVIFPNEPQWFTGAMNTNIDTEALAARGIVFNGPITTQMGTVVNEPAAPAPAPAPAAPAATPQFQAPQTAPQSTVVDQTSGLTMPAPVTQAVAQPVNPVANQVMNAINQQAQGSAFGSTPAATPAPTGTPTAPAPAPAVGADSPWAI